MSCPQKPQAACLPITALHAVARDPDPLLFAGQGPVLHVYSGSGIEVLCERIFESQPIHGIQHLPDSARHRYSPRSNVDVVIWGGSLIQTASCFYSGYGHGESHAKIHLALRNQFDASDWVLHATALKSSLYVLTAHNRLLEVPFSRDADQIRLKSDGQRPLQGPRSFLYSGHVVAPTSDHLIVASGTVFGEIIVWTCFKPSETDDWLIQTRHAFRAHRGSVFGVRISQPPCADGDRKTFLASCSDDRTIAVYEIADCNHIAPDISTRDASNETGFSIVGTTMSAHPPMASGWGHLSRIWGVDFIPALVGADPHRVTLISRGEDGVCQLWTVEPSTSDFKNAPGRKLRPATHDRRHVGKNIWSMSLSSHGDRVRLFTGGGDGQIVVRDLYDGASTLDASVRASTAFGAITGSAQPLKEYLLVDSTTCLATTDAGQVFRINLDHDQLTWECVLCTDIQRGIMLAKLDTEGTVLLAQQGVGLSILSSRHGDLQPLTLQSTSSTSVSWMQVATQHQSTATPPTHCLVLGMKDRSACVVWLTRSENSFQPAETTLQLANTFIPTSCCYDNATQTLILGSRAGALAAYRGLRPNMSVSGPVFCCRHVHGTDAVTSIRVLRSEHLDGGSPGSSLDVLTTGRDGKCAIHRLRLTDSVPEADIILSTVHRFSPSFGPNIEGAYFVPAKAGHGTPPSDLILYGFRSISFVAWNESKQSTIFSVDCGGAHRSWNYEDHTVTSKPVHVPSTSPLLPNSLDAVRSFIWTKAGRMNWCSAKATQGRVLRPGGHGREIKAIARSPTVQIQFENGVQAANLFATGAEDTNIRLFFMPNPQPQATPVSQAPPSPQPGEVVNPGPHFCTLGTLKQHTTGIQHLLFSPSGEFLFSCAGIEEFYVWRLCFDVPSVGVGSVLWDMMPKEEKDADARIMSFDLRENMCVSRKPGHTTDLDPDVHMSPPPTYMLALAYSSGRTRVVRYSPSPVRSQGAFEIIQDIIHGAFCVTQAVYLPREPFVQQVLSSGTNGMLTLDALRVDRTQGLPTESLLSCRVHQNSVLALAVMQLDLTSYLIATGGDDNALGVTILSFGPARYSENTPKATALERRSRHSQTQSLVIPRAHAAAVTGLRLANATHTPSGIAVDIITVGNDQRVKAWKVHLQMEKIFADPNPRTGSRPWWKGVRVQRAGSIVTAVADVSGLEIVAGLRATESTALSSIQNGFKQGLKILVVGVGMEVLAFGT